MAGWVGGSRLMVGLGGVERLVNMRLVVGWALSVDGCETCCESTYRMCDKASC